MAALHLWRRYVECSRSVGQVGLVKAPEGESLDWERLELNKRSAWPSGVA